MTSFKDLLRRNKDRKTRPKRPEYQDRNAQPRLPTPRPRSLTLPLPSTSEGQSVSPLKQRNSPQLTSPLLCLPLEPRIRIYEAVLGNRKVHVSFDFVYHTRPHGSSKSFKKDDPPEWRWWHTICTWDQIPDERCRNVYYDQCRKGKVDGEPGPPGGMMGKLKLDTALLLTCRKVYSEAVTILYSTTIFNFASHSLLLDFPSFILPQRFAAITSIEQMWTFIDFGSPVIPDADKKLYTSLWAFLASMPCLRYLKIAVAAFECPIPVPDELQETWLGPLEQLKGKEMQSFEIWVPESYANHFDIGEGAQFKLNTFSDIRQPQAVGCFGSSAMS